MAANDRTALELPAWFSGLTVRAEGQRSDAGEKEKGNKALQQKGKGAPRKLITLIALLMAGTREVAGPSSTVFVRYMVNAGGGLVSALIAVGKSYVEESQRLHKQQQGGEDGVPQVRGPLHIQLAAAAAYYGADRTLQQGSEQQMKQEADNKAKFIQVHRSLELT